MKSGVFWFVRDLNTEIKDHCMWVAWLVWLIPLFGIVPTVFLKKKLKAYSTVLFSGISLFLALSLALLINGRIINLSFPWIPSLGLKGGFLLDPLSIFMTNIVAFIGFLVTIYSVSYMKRGLGRYYPLILLFIGSMILLILSNNFLQMFIGWELVGVCSYSLIGHYYKKERATRAGIKAFLVTRVGDVALLLGILILFSQTGTFGFVQTKSFINKGKVAFPVLSFVSILFLGGAVGKSAQLPLQVWLPDAMEGPTTVSALIHAATMVKAGVYLLARVFPLFSSIPLWTNSIMYVGGLTAFLAATMALGTTDLKRILAFSTMSQIGYLFMAIGVGNLFGSQFHLLSHALFKALLFLSAGCVIRGLGTRDIRKMGGLRPQMPLTFFAFLIGVLSLSGVPPLNGFWSKESIVSSALAYPVPALLAIVTIPLTVIYSFRTLFQVFFGKIKIPKEKIRRPVRLMWIPLLLLTIGCLITGFFGNSLSIYLGMKKHFALGSAFISLSFVGLGFVPTYYYYYKNVPTPKIEQINELLTKGYYFDLMYKTVFLKGSLVSSKVLNLLETGITKFNQLVSVVTVKLSDLTFRLEESGFDQFNFSAANLGNKVSKRLRTVQTGLSNVNLLFFMGGMIFVILMFMLI